MQVDSNLFACMSAEALKIRQECLIRHHFRRSQHLHTNHMEFDFLSSLSHFSKYVFLCSGYLVGMSSVLYLSRKTESVLHYPAYAVIENRTRLQCLLDLCRAGLLEVETCNQYLFQIRELHTGSIAYVSYTPAVFMDPATFGCLPWIKPVVFLVELLAYSPSAMESLSRFLPTHHHSVQSTACSIQVSELIMQVQHQDLFPAHLFVLSSPVILANFILKSSILIANGWHMCPVFLPDRKLPLQIFQTDQPFTCAITLDTSKEGVQLWCGHTFDSFALVSFLFRGYDTCPLCRASILACPRTIVDNCIRNATTQPSIQPNLHLHTNADTHPNHSPRPQSVAEIPATTPQTPTTQSIPSSPIPIAPPSEAIPSM